MLKLSLSSFLTMLKSEPEGCQGRWCQAEETASAKALKWGCAWQFGGTRRDLCGWDRGREAESRDEVRALKGPGNRVGLGVRWSHGQILAVRYAITS